MSWRQCFLLGILLRGYKDGNCSCSITICHRGNYWKGLTANQYSLVEYIFCVPTNQQISLLLYIRLICRLLGFVLMLEFVEVEGLFPIGRFRPRSNHEVTTLFKLCSGHFLALYLASDKKFYMNKERRIILVEGLPVLWKKSLHARP